MSNTPQPHHIYFVIDNTAGEVSMYATKFLPVTNTKGARLKWWVTNSMLEKIGEAPAMQWSYKYDSQRDELQYRLGPGFTVLRQHEALERLQVGHRISLQKPREAC